MAGRGLGLTGGRRTRSWSSVAWWCRHIGVLDQECLEAGCRFLHVAVIKEGGDTVSLRLSLFFYRPKFVVFG